MKKTCTFLSVLLIFILSVTGICGAEDYIPFHSEEELSALFNRVKSYMDENEELISVNLGETENSIVTQAFVRSWGILESENATPEQIDNAYDALFNGFLFLGLVNETRDALTSDPDIAEAIYQSAVQLLDQEYYDLMLANGETEEAIEYAKYLRDIAEALADDPENFSEEEVNNWLTDIYAELYLASGYKSLDHSAKLPAPEELFAEEEGSGNTMIPNPVVTYEKQDPLDEFLGFKMPNLTDLLQCEVDYYAIIADIVAESCFSLKDGKVIFRLSPVAGADITGVYGYTFDEDWKVYSTEIEIDTYETMKIAWGTVTLGSGEEFSFAIDTDHIDDETFKNIVTFFIETLRNTKLD